MAIFVVPAYNEEANVPRMPADLESRPPRRQAADTRRGRGHNDSLARGSADAGWADAPALADLRAAQLARAEPKRLRGQADNLDPDIDL